MRKIMLTGRSECGKTTLTQALKRKKITYEKKGLIIEKNVIRTVSVVSIILLLSTLKNFKAIYCTFLTYFPVRYFGRVNL